MTPLLFLLCPLQVQVFGTTAEPLPDTKPTPTICELSNIYSLFKRYPDSAPRFCTSYLHYPPTTRTIHTTIHITAAAKTEHKTVIKCTTTILFIINTDYEPILPATTCNISLSTLLPLTLYKVLTLLVLVTVLDTTYTDM